jgi:cobalamin-dependent methionine synthase I
VLENGTAMRCGAFNGLDDCRSVAAFVLTVGAACDDEVRELSERGDLIEALFLETAAWLAIEGATKILAALLRQSASDRGLCLTRRLAPGYGDWALSEQTKLFSLFEGVSLPVRLLESCAMVPKMSRSGMYGLRGTP